jgi:hypothetical protein
MRNNNQNGANHTLSDVKKEVRDTFLGKYGIHGVGIKASNNTVRIYISEESDDLKAAMDSLKLICAPFSLELVIEEEPKVHQHSFSVQN